MATIIDALVVTFGLQPEGFNRGRGEVSRGLKKSREEAAAAGKDFEVFGKRAGDFFGKMRNEAVGLFLAFQGASSVTSFVTDLITGDAATGRLAKNIGMATQELSAWQLAVKSVGGDSREADAALSSMAEALQSFKLTGTTGHDADFKGLGVTLGDLQNPATALMKMAEAGERMDRTEFYARLTRIGIPPSVINLLAQGRGELSKLIEEKKRDGAASEENAEAAAKLQERLAALSAKLMGTLRPAIYAGAGALLELLNWIDKNNAAIPIMTGVLVGLTVAVVAAAGPWVALAGAIAAVLGGFSALIAQNPKIREFLDTIEAPLRKVLPDWMFRRPGDKSEGGGSSWSGGRSGSDADIAAQGKSLGLNVEFEGGPAPDQTSIVRRTFPGYQAPRGGGGNSQTIQAFLRRNGFSAEQARGIMAGIHAESGGNPNALNQSSGAMGIGQWLGPRKKALIGRYGANPTLDQQLQFLLWELQGGDHGGAAVRGQTTAGGTMEAFINRFMRPARGAETAGDLRRGYNFLGGGASRSARPGAPLGGNGGSSSVTTSVGTINVYTAATDAEGIARDLPGQLRRRGLTTQANRGMQ